MITPLGASLAHTCVRNEKVYYAQNPTRTKTSAPETHHLANPIRPAGLLFITFFSLSSDTQIQFGHLIKSPILYFAE